MPGQVKGKIRGKRVIPFSNTRFNVLAGHLWTLSRRLCGAGALKRSRSSTRKLEVMESIRSDREACRDEGHKEKTGRGTSYFPFIYFLTFKLSIVIVIKHTSYFQGRQNARQGLKHYRIL